MPIICPGRLDLELGRTQQFQISDVPEIAGADFFATLELHPATEATKPYLDHNAIPIAFDKVEFEHALANNLVTKVVYLPADHQSVALAGIQTIVSTRLDPGTDPIAEANKRGTIVAVLRLGNRTRLPDVQSDDGARQQTPIAMSGEFAPPSDQSVHRALASKIASDSDLSHLVETSRGRIRIIKEKVSDTIEKPRVYPLVGSAQLRMIRWKCTIYFDESTIAKWPIAHEMKQKAKEVVFLTTQHLHRPDGSIVDAPSPETDAVHNF